MWPGLVAFFAVVSIAGAASFILTRELLSSDDQVAAGGQAVDPSADTRRAAYEEAERLLAADKAKPRFGGELGRYFFIANDDVPVPPSLDGPVPTGPCLEEQIPVTAADTELYVEVPQGPDHTNVLPKGSSTAQQCGDEIVSVTQVATVTTMFGEGELHITKVLLFDPRFALYADAPIDRLVQTTIAGRDALVLESPGGIVYPSRVSVIEQPPTTERPGIVLIADGDMAPEELKRVAEDAIVVAR